MLKNKLQFLTYLLRIRRVEFRIAEIPIIAIPVLLLIENTEPLKTISFWEGIFVFFFLFAFGDMINCLADRDLDAVYKPHLSEAVYGLGIGFVKFQIAASAFCALALSAHLSWEMNHPLIFLLVAAGLMFGAAYSVKPIQLKGRGIAQLICLWLIIFIGPMLFVSLLVAASPSFTFLIFAAFYGTLQMGVILVNTAEDYPEDSEANIKTTVVSVGLKRSISLSFWLTLAGAFCLTTMLYIFFYKQNDLLLGVTITLPVAAAYFYVLHRIWKLKLSIANMTLKGSIQTVKCSAKNVPIWITIAAWSTLGATVALFLSR